MSETTQPAAVPTGPWRTLALAGSSAMGLGYAPIAPGTFGTLAGLPLWWAMSSFAWWWQLAFVVVLTGVSIGFAGLAERIYGEHDTGKIVIDEVAGMCVSVIGIPFGWPEVLIAFLLFRIMDIVKPPPARWLDDNVPGGLGVVIDDVVAGLFALMLMHVGRVIAGTM